MRKPVTRQPEKKAEKIEEKVVEKKHENTTRISIPSGEDNIQYDADPLAPGYTYPTPMQALFYKQVKYYGLHAISDDDIDEFTEFLKQQKKIEYHLRIKRYAEKYQHLWAELKNTNNAR